MGGDRPLAVSLLETLAVTVEPQIFECGGAEPTMQNCSAIPSSELFELFSLMKVGAHLPCPLDSSSSAFRSGASPSRPVSQAPCGTPPSCLVCAGTCSGSRCATGGQPTPLESTGMLAVREDRKAEFVMTQTTSSYRGDDAVGPRDGGHGEAC